MPELPEVESIRRELIGVVTDKRILHVEVLRPSFIRLGSLYTIVGSRIVNLRRRGKYLIFDTETDLKFYVHLRMTGTILWQKRYGSPTTHVRAVIKLLGGKLLFRDVRALGGIWVSNSGEPPWNKMGVEALSEELNAGYLLQAFAKRRAPIKSLLLDQGVIAGIGNIYASEALFKSSIHPLRPANGLNKDEIDRLITAVQEILNAAIKAAGTTFRDFKLSDGKKGGFARFLKVYGKKDELCSICNSAIISMVIAQRNTYYCPKCQII